MRKTESARIALSALNPDVRLELREERLQATNVEALVRGHDVVIDGADNFPTRYLLNAACLQLKIHSSMGAVHRLHGTSQRVRRAPRRFAVLPLPVCRTALPPPRHRLQRGRRTRRAAWRHRSPSGDRGDQARARHWAHARRTPSLLRRARRGIPRALAAARSGVPRLWFGRTISTATRTSPRFAPAIDDRLRTNAPVT